MSDPNPRPSNPTQRPIDPPPSEPRKSASPLIWILLLIALIAFGWYFYSQRGGVDTAPVEPVAPPAADIGSEQEAAAEREREATAAREERRRAAPEPRASADREPSPVASASPAPAYPPSALRAREEGTVLVRAEIDATGSPTNVGIAKRSNSRDLDRAAVNAVRKWKFEPAMKDGKAVASTVQVPVDFKLDAQ